MLREAQSPDAYPLPIVDQDIFTTVLQQFQTNRERFLMTAQVAVESDAVDFAFFCRDIVQLKFGLAQTKPALDHMVVATEMLRRAAVCKVVEQQPDPFLMGRPRGFFGRNRTRHVLPSMIYGGQQREILSQVRYGPANEVVAQHDYYLSQAITGETFLSDMNSVDRDRAVRPTLVLYGLIHQLALRR